MGTVAHLDQMCEKWCVQKLGCGTGFGGQFKGGKAPGFAWRGLLLSEAGGLNKSYLQIHTYVLCLKDIFICTHTC